VGRRCSADFATVITNAADLNIYCRHWVSWHKTKRPGLGLSHKALSRSALPQVLLNHRIEPKLFRVNGTEVPNDITLRPYRHSLLRLNLYPLAAGTLESGDNA
jgi:hypothetical protein